MSIQIWYCNLKGLNAISYFFDVKKEEPSGVVIFSVNVSSEAIKDLSNYDKDLIIC